jgi:hypothetical protein
MEIKQRRRGNLFIGIKSFEDRFTTIESDNVHTIYQCGSNFYYEINTPQGFIKSISFKTLKSLKQDLHDLLQFLS